VEKSKVVRGYLGGFLKRPLEETKSALKGIKVREQNIVVSTSDFNGAISFLLMSSGRQVYEVLSSSQIIDIYLGKDLKYLSLGEIRTPVLFIVAMKGEMENKQRWNLIFQVCFERMMGGLSTTILSDMMDRAELIKYQEAGFLVLGGVIKKGRSTAGDIF